MLSKTNRSRMTVAAAVLLASLIVAAPVLAAAAMTVQSVRVSGGVVQVTVKNMSDAPISGMVAVQAVVNDTPIWSFVPVSLRSGESAIVAAGFSGPVSSVGTVSIQDDNVPY